MRIDRGPRLWIVFFSQKEILILPGIGRDPSRLSKRYTFFFSMFSPSTVRSDSFRAYLSLKMWQISRLKIKTMKFIFTSDAHLLRYSNPRQQSFFSFASQLRQNEAQNVISLLWIEERLVSARDGQLEDLKYTWWLFFSISNFLVIYLFKGSRGHFWLAYYHQGIEEDQKDNQ